MARNNHLRIAYVDNDDLRELSKNAFLMSTIRVEKNEVIESCVSHRLFPPKSTRHLIPSRPLGLAFPLALLKREIYSEAESAFVQHIRSMHIRRRSDGWYVGCRSIM